MSEHRARPNEGIFIDIIRHRFTAPFISMVHPGYYNHAILSAHGSCHGKTQLPISTGKLSPAFSNGATSLNLH